MPSAKSASSARGPRRPLSRVGALLSVLLVAATLRVTVDKNLVGTFDDHEWGRYLFAMGAALTQLRWGISGYVIDSYIEMELGVGGLTGTQSLLEPLGTKLPDNLRDERLMQAALERAYKLDLPPPPAGDYSTLRGSHGDDVGAATFTALAFFLFGVGISSIFYLFFSILGLSVLLFIVTHAISRAAMAHLGVLALGLFVLCRSDLVNLNQEVAPFAGLGGSDIKDPRFFGALAAFPVLHIAMIWLRRDVLLGKLDYLAVLLQASILALCIHVRWSIIWVFVPLVLAILVSQTRRAIGLSGLGNRIKSQPILAAAVVACAVAGELVGASMAAHPLYRLDHDLLHHPVWHNLMTALGNHPDWAAKYGATVNGATGDAMAAEIALQGVAALPPDQRAPYIYSHINFPNPEAVMHFVRERFMQIFHNDPRFVLETFLVYQPKIMFSAAWWFYESALPALKISDFVVIGSLFTSAFLVVIGRCGWLL